MAAAESWGDPCPGYGLNGCPDRYRCYPLLPSDLEALKYDDEAAQCMCNRILMFSGDNCEKVHPLVYCLIIIRTFCVLQVTLEGCSAFPALLERRNVLHRRRNGSLASLNVSIFACVAILLADTCLCILSVIDVVRLWATLGFWYYEYTQLILQGCLVVSGLISIVTVAHFFFETARQVQIIQDRALALLRFGFVGFEVAVVILGVVFPGGMLGAAHMVKNAMMIAAGLFSIISITLGGVKVKVMLHRSIAQRNEARNTTSLENIHRSCIKLTSFTKRYVLFQIALNTLLAVADFLDKNYNSVPPLAVHLVMQLVYVCILAISYTIYGFLLPSSTTDTRFTTMVEERSRAASRNFRGFFLQDRIRQVQAENYLIKTQNSMVAEQKRIGAQNSPPFSSEDSKQNETRNFRAPFGNSNKNSRKGHNSSLSPFSSAYQQEASFFQKPKGIILQYRRGSSVIVPVVQLAADNRPP